MVGPPDFISFDLCVFFGTFVLHDIALHCAGPHVTKQQAASRIRGAEAGAFIELPDLFLFAICLGARLDIVFKSCLSVEDYFKENLPDLKES